jgi:hypothetical protein
MNFPAMGQLAGLLTKRVSRDMTMWAYEGVVLAVVGA